MNLSHWPKDFLYGCVPCALGNERDDDGLLSSQIWMLTISDYPVEARHLFTESQKTFSSRTAPNLSPNFDQRSTIRGRCADVPTTPHFGAQLALQLLDLMTIKPPKVGVLIQSMPSLYWSDLAFKVDTRRQVKQFFDDSATCRPRLIYLRPIICTSQKWRRRHHHVICRISRRWVRRRGYMRHAWMLKCEDKVDGDLNRIHKGRTLGVGCVCVCL